MKKVNQKMKIVLWIRHGFFILVMLGILLGIIFGCKEHDFVVPLGICLGICFGFISLFLIIYPILYYKRYGYSYDENRIYISYGVIFYHRIVVPVVQLQDIHIFQGPVMQLFHVTSVIFSTAGSNFSIAFLDKEDAKEMVEFLEVELKKKIKVGDESSEEIC